MRRGALASIAAAAAFAGALALAGCGSSSVGNVIDPVAQAATVSNQASGMRMNLAMRISASALPAPITGSGAGAFDTTDHAGSFSLSLDLGSIPQVTALLGTSTLRIDEILEGGSIYLKLPRALSKNQALHGKPWAKINLAGAASALGVPSFGTLLSNPASSNPTQLLGYLRATSGSVTKVGSQTVDGVQTTHYRARIELDRVPNAFPAAERAEVRQTIASLEQAAHVHAIPVDVWVDHQHLVRRMALSMAASASGQALTIALRIDVPQYGPQPPPRLPPASEVADMTQAAAGH